MSQALVPPVGRQPALAFHALPTHAVLFYAVLFYAVWVTKAVRLVSEKKKRSVGSPEGSDDTRLFRYTTSSSAPPGCQFPNDATIGTHEINSYR